MKTQSGILVGRYQGSKQTGCRIVIPPYHHSCSVFDMQSISNFVETCPTIP